MEDLYIEPYRQPYGPAFEDGPEILQVGCDGCEKPLDVLSGKAFLVGTMNGQTPMCAKCAERVFRSWKGTKHDRREDPEKLLRECEEVIFALLHGPADERPTAEEELADLAARINRR